MSDEDYKVVGELDSDHGAGVYGHNTATSGAAVGVEGRTESGEGYGLYTADDAHVGGALEAASKTPRIVVYEDEDGTPTAVTESETYTGACVFDAAQAAADARIAQASREAYSSDEETTGGNLHLYFKPGVYDLTTTLSFTEGEDSQGLESVHIESPNMYGAYLRTDGLDAGPVIHFNPEGDPVGADAADRWRGVSIRNLFLDNMDSKSTFEGGETARNIDGIALEQGMRMLLENVHFRGFRQALRITNVFEGKVDNLRVTSSGSSAAGTAAVLVQEGSSGFSVAADAVNHIEFNNLRGGHNCQEALFRTRGWIEEVVVNYPSPELDCLGFDVDGRALVVSNGLLGSDGSAPIFRQTGGELMIDGGAYEPGAEFGVFGPGDGTFGHTSTHVSNCYISGSDSHDVFVVQGTDLHVDNTYVKDGRRGIQVADSDDSGDTAPWSINVSDSTILDPAEDGIWMDANNKIYRWKVSNVSVVSACGSGDGNPVTILADDVDVSDVDVSVADGVPAKAGVVVGGENVSVRDVVPNGNVSTPVDRSGGSVRENRGAATIDAGSTSTTVTHGLSEAPPPEAVQVTPHDPLNDASHWYVSSIGATTFDIAVDADPGSDVQFSWAADLQE